LDRGTHAFEKIGVYTIKEELGAGGSKLGTEHSTSLGKKILDYRWRVMDRYGLESHAHQAVGGILAGLKTDRIMGYSANLLVPYLWLDV
jgi:hypothetical protein